ncbi:MAG: D-alanyl-D-alanine carboxypeptidase [Bacteroidales bacterium]
MDGVGKKKSGIKRINGRVIADASLFEYFPAPGGWSWSDLGNYYGAGAHGLSVNDNMYRIHFATGRKGQPP